MGRLHLISNRLPITMRRVGGNRVVQRSTGGLVAGLGPIHDEGEGLWIGTLGTGRVGHDAKELAKQRLVAVDVPAEQAKRHYEGYSNQVLWPLFHYLLARVTFHGQDFEAYRRVNERFADVVAEHAEPDDLIWVHDYHLMLLPAMLRERLPNAGIGFFLHIPFPSSEVFRILPRKEEILRGLLGANLIGLHTYDYGRHLVSSFRRVLGVEFDDDWVYAGDGRCKVGVFPLGVDVESLQEAAASPAVERRVERLEKIAAGRKVILGVDRMDYTKGLVLRMQAFRRLLESERRWRKQATFWQLAVPSRASISSYKQLKQETDRLVGAINGDYEQDGQVPIHYMYRSLPKEELVALYRFADVAFVTPVRDGMNLVAKEYAACRLDDTGVLVLSEFAGAASEMGEALLCNPWDTDGTARTLDRALLMDKGEVRQRMAALRKRVRNNTVHHWVQRFVKSLEDQVEHARSLQAARGGPESVAMEAWVPEMTDTFAKARRALLALDYDGTLMPLKPVPSAAAPDDDLKALLAQLADLQQVEVVVISGRDPETLDDWLGELPISLVAEHGLHWRLHGHGGWELLLPDFDMSWKAAVRDILENYASRCPGAFVEEKHASLAWHYRQVEPAFGGWQSRELAQHLSETFANSPLEVLHGSKVVEVRPQGFDKGKAYGMILQRLGDFEFQMTAGDDRTDEDMFQQVPRNVWTIKVGFGQTHAKHRLLSPAALRRMLTAFIAARRQLLEAPAAAGEGR